MLGDSRGYVKSLRKTWDFQGILFFPLTPSELMEKSGLL